jgi:uncharacterized cupredoxin-like copper-binding protein
MRFRSTVPVLVVSLALGTLPGCGGGGHDSSGNSAPVAGADVIDVKAHTFAFEPEEITVKAGQDATIALRSTDIEHDFTVDELHIHVHTGPGKTTKGGIKPDQPGRYQFYCSIPGHKGSGMVGTLIVQ